MSFFSDDVDADDTYEVEDAKAVHASPSALLVESPEFAQAQWIPLAVIHDNSQVFEKGHEGMLVVKAWFAEKRGWA